MAIFGDCSLILARASSGVVDLQESTFLIRQVTSYRLVKGVSLKSDVRT